MVELPPVADSTALTAIHELLLAVSASFAQTLDLAAGLQVFADRAGPLFGASRTSVWLHDRRARELVLHAASDGSPATPVRIRTEDGQDPIARGMRSEHAVLQEIPAQDGPDSQRLLTVPLRGHRRALGTVVFHGVQTDPGTQNTLLGTADQLGRQLSFMIENVQLLEAVLRAHQRQAQSEKLAALGQFVAGVAHELNNPLQGVLGNIELLRTTSDLPPGVRRALLLVHREAHRAARIVGNLLVFAGSRPMPRRRVSFNAVLSRALALRASARRAAGVHLSRQFDEQLPRIKGNPLLLQQAFLNIFLNAEQALETTPQPRIEVRTSSAPARGIVAADIRDNGPGIPADALTRIFDPFFTTKEVGRGTGLGLAIAYAIVREHGGTIVAANHPEGGARFTVELPAAGDGSTLRA